MKKQTIISFALIAVVVFAAIFGIMQCAGNKDVANKEQAEKKLAKMVKKVSASEKELTKGTVDIGGSNTLAEELPDISKYPISLEGSGKINIEIFAAPEKAGSDTDGWMIEAAKRFNKQKHTIDGKSVAITIRSMSSGTGADYITSGKYLPDAYSPSSSLWGQLIETQGQKVEVYADKLTGNVAGILVSQKVKKELKDKYGKVDFKTVVEATAVGDIAMGYTNPFSSSTGLNFLLETLYIYDSQNILSDTAIDGFAKFQKNVPFVAYTTQQMRDAADSGTLDGMVNEYQTYINDKKLSNYEFIPFGIRHDGPMYAIGNLSENKKEALRMFTEYCLSDEMQDLAKDYGFNQMDDYNSELPNIGGATIMEAQNLWKENKDNGSSITAVFVADISGSMGGDPINQLKESLINAGKYIDKDNSIGLVSFNNKVFIDLPIAKFDLNQRSYFNGAVDSLVALGGTATYDGIVVATDMLMKAKEADPTTKPVLFLLSDGRQNEGYNLSQVSSVLKSLEIPVYSIAYGDDADMDELNEISGVNEAAVIKADSDDVVYKLKNLFNAQM